jgi:hypothetical protein
MHDGDEGAGRDRTKSREVLQVTGESRKSFAAAAEAAWKEGRRLADEQKKTVTRAEVVKMEIVAGSAIYSVTLAFPEF